MRVARFCMLVIPLFCSRCRTGHQTASAAAPKDKRCFFGGTAKATADPQDGGGAETRRAGRSRGAQFRRARLGVIQPSSEAVPGRRETDKE